MYPIETAYAGFLLWDIAHAESVLSEWSAWAPSAPDEITTSFRVMRLPEMPELPDFLRGRELVVVDGAVHGSDELGERLLAGLRGLGPELDTFARVPASSLVRLHMDPEGGAPFTSDAAMLGGFPAAAVDAFLAEVGPGIESPLLLAELRQLGGALARPHAGGGVLSHLDAEFLAFAGAMAVDAETTAAGHAAAARLTEALAPYANGRQYLNFAENPVDVRSAYPEKSWRQLAGIRSAVDPDGLFVGNHPVPRLYEDGHPTT
jgi:FAD/FMN-containing dehydrogenase